MKTLRKLAPNCHVFLSSITISDDKAKKIIQTAKKNHKRDWYTFEVRGDEIIVGYNLWNDLGLKGE